MEHTNPVKKPAAAFLTHWTFSPPPVPLLNNPAPPHTH